MTPEEKAEKKRQERLQQLKDAKPIVEHPLLDVPLFSGLDKSSLEKIFDETWEIGSLQIDFPPVWDFEPKRKLQESVPKTTKGSLRMTRWKTPGIGGLRRQEVNQEVRTHFYQYEESSHWYMNFSNVDLFVAYSTAAFAQDEVQVFEHPVLGSLREFLLSVNKSTLTVENGCPTPILLQGVPRTCKVEGLYGNSFSRASWEEQRASLEILEKPTCSNILALEAIPGGWGHYSQEEILYHLWAVVAGYAATKLVTGTKTTIHTGFWGCGAYGGNRTMMALIQSLGAEYAGVDLVFHTGDEGDLKFWEEAQKKKMLLGDDLEENLLKVFEMNFEWGFSDGS